MSQTVLVSAPGSATEYTWPLTLTESSGNNISADTVQISLGTYAEPGTWQTPDLSSSTADSVTAQMLIDSSTAPGTYWVWIYLEDSPEMVPRRGHRLVVV